MSRHYRSRAPGDDRTSLYDEITNKIIAELEAGRVPWVQPGARRRRRRRLAMPKNAATGRHIQRHQRADPLGCGRSSTASPARAG